MKHTCKKCGFTGKLILKMGGLICNGCRTIVFYPSELEWKEQFIKQNSEYNRRIGKLK